MCPRLRDTTRIYTSRSACHASLASRGYRQRLRDASPRLHLHEICWALLSSDEAVPVSNVLHRSQHSAQKGGLPENLQIRFCVPHSAALLKTPMYIM